MTRAVRRWITVGAVTAAAVLAAAPASGVERTFPGPNGVLAFSSASERGADIWAVCPDGTGIQRLVKTPGDGISAYSDWSPDGRLLAFDSDRAGSVDLYLLRPDGRVRRLTRAGSGDSHPAFAPNGRRIAFESDRTGTKQVWSVRRDGSGLRQVTDFGPGAEEPAYSPTGRWIAFLSGPIRRTALFVVRPDGSRLHQLTPRRLNAGHPSWSPDGSRIVFNTHIEKRNGRIWTVDLGGHRTRVTDGPEGQEDFEPTYSPDGRLIAFSRFVDDPSTSDIWVADADGTGARDVTPGRPGFDVGAAWAVATPGRC